MMDPCLWFFFPHFLSLDLHQFIYRKGTLLTLRHGPALSDRMSPPCGRREQCSTGPAHLVVSVHHLEASAGLLLLHVAQRTLQAEDHVVRLLDHLRSDNQTRHGCENMTRC